MDCATRVWQAIQQTSNRGLPKKKPRHANVGAVVSLGGSRDLMLLVRDCPSKMRIRVIQKKLHRLMSGLPYAPFAIASLAAGSDDLLSAWEGEP